ncbi:uncharacterized protein ACMZJ9_014328 [Mantella aurantiaca]
MDSREGPIRLHFHEAVQINIHPPSQPRWDDPPPVPHPNNTAVDSLWNVPRESQRRDDWEQFHEIFLRAKPKLRGVFQIFMAHFQLALGVALIYIGGRNYTRMSFITFWGPTILVISGSMTLRARVIPSYKLVKACLILHTFSCSTCFSGIILCCIDDFMIYTCNFNCDFGNVGTLAIINFLLITNIVQLVSSGYILVYSYRSLKHISRNPPQITGALNLGAMSLDPPAYSEESTVLPQLPAFSQPLVFVNPSTFLHTTESAVPPGYSHPPGYSQPEFPQTADPPPPYSE